MTTTLNPFIAEAEQLASGARSTEPAWLAEARLKALASFNRLGFPTTRDEEWRSTSVAPIADGSFTLARDGAALTRADVDSYRWITEPAITLVFADGVYRRDLSSLDGVPAGVWVGRPRRRSEGAGGPRGSGGQT